VTTDAARYALEFDLPLGVDPAPILQRVSVCLRNTEASMVEILPVADEVPPAAQQQEHEPCRECDGHLTVYTSKRRGSCVVQYVRCWSCKWKPEDNRRVLSADDVPRRRNRKNRPTKVQPNCKPQA